MAPFSGADREYRRRLGGNVLGCRLMAQSYGWWGGKAKALAPTGAEEWQPSAANPVAGKAPPEDGTYGPGEYNDAAAKDTPGSQEYVETAGCGTCSSSDDCMWSMWTGEVWWRSSEDGRPRCSLWSDRRSDQKSCGAPEKVFGRRHGSLSLPLGDSPEASPPHQVMDCKTYREELVKSCISPKVAGRQKTQEICS